MDFQTFRSWFDDAFLKAISEKTKLFNSYSSSTDVQAMSEYLTPLASHGKRFRPYLAYVASGVDSPEDHKDLFFGIELLHIYALIHDDIMDNGTMRHGVACAHQLFSKTYNNTRVGEGVAILLGDLVYQWSYESLIAYTQKYPESHTRIFEVFNTLVREVIHGQMLDVISPVQSPYELDLIVKKMYLKTARYSFVHPMRLGNIVAGKFDELESFADSYGTALGLMFQIQDDLIDVTTTSNKSSFLDIETNQQTVLSWCMQTKADKEHKEIFVSFLGKKLTDEDKIKVSELFDASGARVYAQSEIEKYYKAALDSIVDREVWKEVATMVHKRSS